MKNFLRNHLIPSRINLILVGFFLFVSSLQAQTLQENDKKLNRETNKILKTAEEELGENDFSSAEASYRKAVSKNESSTKARYNMANMYYGKEKPAQATSRYKEAAKVAETKDAKHDVFHNMGNSYMDQKKYAEAIAAYKNALRNNPTDEQTRYNLALAKKMLEKQQQENKDQDDKKDDQKDKEQEKEDQNKEKKEDEQGEKDKKDQGDNKENEGGDKEKEPKKEPEKPDDKGEPKDQKEQKDEKGDQEKEQPQQPQSGQLSPQQIKNLLEAMNNEEKKVQDKINAEKAKGAKTRTAKDW
ncbi:TPR repeat protein [Gillisia sp. Hel_I_86]|uniref:tetratricopeptide repeat protein n=1 Tax=Gillisia sp. Hel_I_86 TaxID=1249981 RepID=UPI001199F816|nr:tetratricopeptide repeat protein [Gillisia sp. Hel_I_86]TVZ26231.1 TPR repeat protein [Gillisia sp. Hel_I_86]